MAYGRSAASHGTWFQEQQTMINQASQQELDNLSDGFDKHFETTVGTLKRTYNGINVMKDAKRMMENPAIMEEYKEMLLQPIIREMQQLADDSESDAEKVHLESVIEQLDKAWDSSVNSFLVQESYNVSNYLPLATLDFPALVKQYVRFLGKELVPVQTASSTNIEQRIFVKYLVNNQTGEEYETPKIWFVKDEDGKPLWKKLWNAGKGYRIKDNAPILLSTIQAAANKKFDMYTWLLDDDGNDFSINRKENLRARLSYDFNINYVQIGTAGSNLTTYAPVRTKPDDWDTKYTTYYAVNPTTGAYAKVTAVANGEPIPAFESGKYYTQGTVAGGSKVKLPGAGIAIDVQNGGVFENGRITEDMVLPVVDENNIPTGATVTGVSDYLSGIIDFVKGYLTASSCGTITGIYVQGRMSNETNLRTVGFREYPEIRKFLISDGMRFQLPFTVEDFAEANASLNFNLYNRLVQELVTAQEMFEDQYILDFLDDEFARYDGAETDVFALDSYTHTEYVDMDPTAISPTFAGDPWEYRTNAIHNALNSLIYEICDKGKLENIGFVIYANPKATRLLKKFVSWTVTKSTNIGGIMMNHAFGVMSDSEIPIRVVASNRIDAYMEIPAYQANRQSDTQMSREYYFKIVAYPMDKFHIGYKHLRFARHLTNSPENAGYADINNPGGQAVLVTTSSQYRMIAIQGIQGRLIFKNTALVPDIKAGLVGGPATTPAGGQGTGGSG